MENNRDKTWLPLLLTMIQALIFNTWGQIAQSAKIAFCWSDATVAWTSNIMLIGVVR